VSKGPDRGREIQVGGRPVTVGTDGDCDLVLVDGSVSRVQFEVRATPLGFLLRDPGSTNGTFLGQSRVREVYLPPSATIRVGRSQIDFATLDAQQELPLSRHHRFGELLGHSPAMRRCFALLEQAAATDSTVLIEGESGTGKELAAESLHRSSRRAEQPFVIVDCGAIPANLIESELFGHKKGAFTGALHDRVGAFEAAHGGTLFLDEIGELDLAMQPRLLRFLERRQVRPVGGADGRTVDVRVIAATNRRLDNLVAEGGFREDLFFRLAVIRCQLPSLRERPEDIPVIALELARKIRPACDPAAWLGERALRVLESYHWPGNVRELRNVLERLAALPEVDPSSLLAAPGAAPAAAALGGLADLPYHQAKEQVVDAFERRYLEEVLARERGVVARAAERAGVPRQTLFRLIRKHGLRGGE
jgi:transcriptional regulator with PAS, ATPase and Fis domain